MMMRFTRVIISPPHHPAPCLFSSGQEKKDKKERKENIPAHAIFPALFLFTFTSVIPLTYPILLLLAVSMVRNQ
ncbi:uncharacterized protein ASPGLDRAFT_48558 [Aspergillus glaucus CBS 516.65]|uniref:Transmembrane protein n=1 Tax=Aspergillus glaucus CBS 516.65 TaxID=1160497 RepID=A0A1L9VGV2_ASPGL|nr:hypothetical protein ASPGLDRAFT_48558 [Aspergillus glaucus CBS 516.65]OJJ83178.1 hypothetical protein ASPGLDRAFT_48558 [Aspergillus glaucus CBS 516.65]